MTAGILAVALMAALATGEVRYLSADGDDAKDGTKPNSAWRTLDRMSKGLPSGGEARLRCGDVFYGRISLKPGKDAAHPTVLTSWGKGPKPVVCGYRIPRRDPGAWTSCGDHLWELDLQNPLNFIRNASLQDGNIGFIKVGDAIHGRKFFCREKLREQWDFHSDGRTLTVWSESNPASVGSDLHLAPNVGLLPFRDHVTVRGISFRGTGAHGSNGVGCGLRFVDCEFSEIGGSVLPGKGGNLNGTTRYGNGIECWAGSTDIQVSGCAFSDIYDVAFTLQGNRPFRSWENVHVTRCRFARCSQACELWTTDCGPGVGIRNCSFTSNRVEDTGYGWAYEVRPDRKNSTPLLMYRMDTDVCDFTVKDNVFVRSRGLLLFKSGGIGELPAGYRISDNTVIGPADCGIGNFAGDEPTSEERTKERLIRETNRFVDNWTGASLPSQLSATLPRCVTPPGGRWCGININTLSVSNGVQAVRL